MPCDQVRTQVLNWQNVDVGILIAALKANGWFASQSEGRVAAYKGRMFLDFREGVLTTQNVEDVNVIKRSYSEQAVKTVARKFGWQQATAAGGQQVLRKAW